MRTFASYDATTLACHELGTGPPLVCLAGGPGRSSAYLEDLGGLAAHRTLLLLDARGTGGSAKPTDPATYRIDRMVDDVEALRGHFGLDRVDLLGHSAGGTLATLYAARHPDRIGRLLLITPGLRAVGLAMEGFDEAIAARRAEPWFPEAHAALLDWVAAAEQPGAPAGHTMPLRLAAAPLFYGRWDDRARAHAAAERHERGWPATAGAYAGFDPDTAAVRAALSRLDAPVLVLAGERDPGPTPAAARALADLFPNGRLAVQPDAGHFPWVDDPTAFVAAVSTCLD